VYEVHGDHLDTPRMLTDSTGAPAWRAYIEAYGNAHVDSPSGIQFNVRFPGQYYDEEVGIVYNWFRYYDPALGRYISTDPMGQGSGPNLYRYASSSPLTRIDPAGLLDPYTPNGQWMLAPFRTWEFVSNYLRGGTSKSLEDMGLGHVYENASSTRAMVSEFTGMADAAARSAAEDACGDCDQGTASTGFSLSGGRGTTDVTRDPGLYSVGGSRPSRGAECEVKVNCGTREYVFSCRGSFDLRDEFSDPLRFRENFGSPWDPRPPYPVNHQWTEPMTGGGQF